MNTHKPDPSKPIDTTNLEPILMTPSANEGKLNTIHEMYIITKPVPPSAPVACVCNSETGATCMLHFNLDGFILRTALEES